MELDSVLSKQKQNIIFANNGTGKSFLSRAFRSIKLAEQIDEKDLHNSLNSQESILRTGSFEFGYADQLLLKLELRSNQTVAITRDPDTIFHVFSSDFVDEELRTRGYTIDDEIDHEIIVGTENSDLMDLQATFAETQIQKTALWAAVSTLFANAKNQLKDNFAIRANLNNYKALSPEQLLQLPPRSTDAKTLLDLKEDFDTLASAPEDIAAPATKSEISHEIDVADLHTTLSTTYPDQETFSKIKDDFRENSDFFLTGISHSDGESCYFCKQNFGTNAKNLFHLYEAYLEDKTIVTQKKLTEFVKSLQKIINELTEASVQNSNSTIKYGEAAKYFSDFEDLSIDSLNEPVSLAVKAIESYIATIEQKKVELTKPIEDLDFGEFEKKLETLNETIRRNNNRFSLLENAIKNRSRERSNIQRNACVEVLYAVFEQTKDQINLYLSQSQLEINQKAEIEQLKLTSGDKVKAKLKVADTFSRLIYTMFGPKYTFDKDNFILKIGEEEMTRGGAGTFSDGEKSIIAFCYYIAQMHLIVETKDDYPKIFMVIDDPMTSLSNNYIFSVTNLLKNMRIKDGDIVLSPSSDPRPKKLILTHNDYFFNIISGSNVVKKSGHFELSEEGDNHVIRNQSDFLSPHSSHLKVVYLVASGRKPPDFQTGNSIRSVIEGIWRFCRNDKPNLTEFLTLASDEHDVSVSSSLINQLSHAVSFSDIGFVESDIIQACVDAINIVDCFASGQTSVLEEMYEAS